MSESTLSLKFEDFKKEVGAFLGFGTAYGSMTADEQFITNSAIKNGLLQFYNPSIIGPEFHHEWSFLRPQAFLTTNANYTTGTVTIASGVVTGSGTTFPSWAADGIVIVSSAEYTVKSRDSDTQLTLDDTSVTAAAGSSYVLSRRDMDLPDDFGGIHAGFRYPADEGKSSIQLTTEYEIERRRASSTDAGHPRLVAIRALKSTQLGGQRYRAMFWPDPDASYQLIYRYKVLPDYLVDVTAEYPYGGALHSQTIQASVLSAAERHLDPAPSVYAKHTYFLERLQASISLDRRSSRADNLGYNGEWRWQRRHAYRRPGFRDFFDFTVTHDNQ